MRTLVAYYSRTGRTEKIAYEIARLLTADTERIVDLTDRSGIKGWLAAGADGTMGKMTTIAPAKHQTGAYDLVVLGTPVWVGVAPAVRTFVYQNRLCINNVAFFCTMDGSGPGRAFADLQKATGKTPLAQMAFRAENVINGQYASELSTFVTRIRQSVAPPAAA